jgi:predicted MarR family transcription regulator
MSKSTPTPEVPPEGVPGVVNEARRIVSSTHLVSQRAAELSEFEFGLIIAGHAFNRWMMRCMTAAGYGDLNPLDVIILHTVFNKARDKKLADICFVLNVEDTHVVNYALKRLEERGLVLRTRKGKEVFFSISDKGRESCQRYRDVREECLIDACVSMGIDLRAVGALSGQLRALSGLYGQAARAAAVLYE